MNFSLDWFLTIPGMLVTGGVLLLIIAIITFIICFIGVYIGKKFGNKFNDKEIFDGKFNYLETFKLEFDDNNNLIAISIINKNTILLFRNKLL